MPGRLEMNLDVEGLYGAPRLDALGRQVVTGLLALAEAGGMGTAMEEVIALSAEVEGARVRGDVASVMLAEAQLADAWRTLSVVHERVVAQAEVAEGKRLPLMGARPPAPYAAGREEALVRSAMAYVRGAVETRDVAALERARALVEMARR